MGTRRYRVSWQTTSGCLWVIDRLKGCLPGRPCLYRDRRELVLASIRGAGLPVWLYVVRVISWSWTLPEGFWSGKSGERRNLPRTDGLVGMAGRGSRDLEGYHVAS